MKTAIITDTHFGARDGSPKFHDFFERFYRDTFFPTLQQEGIKTVLHLGDMFDKRKQIDYYSLKRSIEYFFQPALDAGIEVISLVGNHDIALRNTLEINSQELLLSERFDNVLPITEPMVLDIHGFLILMMPWICADNADMSMGLLKSAKAEICMGHFEIAGFSMYRGLDSHDGMSPTIFDRFDMVFSGHYHYKSSAGNITYLGNPYQITHMDQGDQRGFHIFDLATRQLTFIPNPYVMFERHVYNDEREDPRSVDVSVFKDKYIKIIVEKKTDFYQYDAFLERVYACGAHDVKIVEELAVMHADDLDDEIKVEDTQAILEHYIESVETSVDRSRLLTLMSNLYIEALNTKT